MKKQTYIVLGLFALLSVSACGNTQEIGEPDALIQEVHETAEPDTAVQEVQETAEPDRLVQEVEETAESDTAVQEIQETVEPEEMPRFDLSSYGLQYGQQEEFRRLYEQIRPVEQAEMFEGTWNRTGVASTLGAEIAITEQTEEGFAFEGDFYYFSHSGWIEGTAYFIASNVAIFEYTQDIFEETEDTASEYLVFERTQEGMQVYASASSADLGFGMNVSADGSYVQGEPQYTNATVLEDNFTVDVQEAMQGLLGDDYEDCFKTVVEFGVIISTPAALEDGTKATFYEAFIPTMGGYAFEMLSCENGDIYFSSEVESVGWRTNVPGATDYPPYILMEE